MCVGHAASGLCDEQSTTAEEHDLSFSGESRVSSANPTAPWQLRLFRKTLKKQQKLRLLLSHLAAVPGERFLLVTSGDNNGALNWHFRDSGGSWTWVEMENESVEPIGALLGEAVLKGEPDRIPVEDAAFDVTLSVDVHEHLPDCAAFNRELRRITRPGGHVIVTTPNGDSWKPVTVLKRAVGMTKETYGHRVYGYSIRQHTEMLREVDLVPVASGSYSRFFTEMLELGINFTYVKLLSRRDTGAKNGKISPTTGAELRRVEKQVRLYSKVYPVLNAISRLDVLMPFFTGYAVSVVARREE
jgi:SAM-dependent methyltransferase